MSIRRRSGGVREGGAILVVYSRTIDTERPRHGVVPIPD